MLEFARCFNLRSRAWPCREHGRTADGLGAAPPQGLEQFREEHGRYPDLVVLHSNYWDIAQIVLFRWWEAWEPEYVALMRDWLERADKVARFLEVRCCPPCAVGTGVSGYTVCHAATLVPAVSIYHSQACSVRSPYYPWGVSCSKGSVSCLLVCAPMPDLFGRLALSFPCAHAGEGSRDGHAGSVQDCTVPTDSKLF